MMKFSILIAHFNHFEYFKKCYESIQNQTYTDFEVIVVDDCSTDGSWGRLQKYVGDDQRFHFYKNDLNRGVGYTKKRCVELATGEICGFVDPDDALTPNALAKSLMPYENVEIVGTHSQMYICDEYLNVNKTYLKSRKISPGNRFFFNIHFEISHFFTFRKSAYMKTAGLQPKYTLAEDMDLYLKLYELGEIRFVKEPLYYYRVHGKGLSHNQEKISQRTNCWNHVLKDALKRRGIDKLYGKKVDSIDNLSNYIFQKENTIFKKLKRKLGI